MEEIGKRKQPDVQDGPGSESDQREETTSGAGNGQRRRNAQPGQDQHRIDPDKKTQPKETSSQYHQPFELCSRCKRQQGQASKQKHLRKYFAEWTAAHPDLAGVACEQQSGSPPQQSGTEELFRQADDEQHAERSQQDVKEEKSLQTATA